MKNGSTLRAHLAWLVALAALPLAALVIVNVSLQERRDADAAVFDAQRLAASAARRTERTIERARHLLAALAARNDLASPDGSHCGPAFGQFPALFSDYINLVLVRADGAIVCSALDRGRAAPDRVDARQRRELERALANHGFTISKPLQRGVNGHWIVFAAQPLEAAPTLVAAVSIELAGLTLVEPSDTLPPGLVAQVVDEDGVILASSVDAAQRIGTRVPESTPWLGAARGAAPASGTLDSADGGVYFAATPVPGTSWHAVVAVPASAILTPARERARLSAAAIVAVLAASLGLAGWILRRTARPVEALAALARQAARTPLAPAAELVLPAMKSASLEVRQLGADLRTLLEARDAAQFELHAGEERYRRIVETAHEGIWQLDAGGHTVYANARLAEILGLAADELGAAAVTDFVGADEAAPLLVGSPAPIDLRLRRRDGR
ncbi:MAG: PAS domain S-box protein, partial [Burkholderiales bacterium]|nr:PAS domain S-box protein [Burkholderiales bacterium]